MTPEERDLIAGLADRLRNADNNTAPKDREAEQFIRQIVAEQPSAPYLLVQTVLVQEHALTNAQTRIAALERQVADLSSRTRDSESEKAGTGGGVGSFLSGLLGGKSATPSSTSGSASMQPRPGAAGASAPPPVPRQSAPAEAPQTAPQQQSYPSTMNMPPSAGGGFLRGALATAAGVAGGAMLFQGLQGLLGHNSGPFGGGGAGFGGGGFGGGGFGGGHLTGGGQHPLETGGHDVTNNYYYGDQGGGARESGVTGSSPEEDAESHSDMLMQSSEPVNEGGGDDYRAAEGGDSGNDDVAAGSDNLFADSGGGDSYDSGGGSGDSGDYV